MTWATFIATDAINIHNNFVNNLVRYNNLKESKFNNINVTLYYMIILLK